MAVVSRQGEWYVVELGGQVLGWFGSLLDAHCFAMQLIERDLTDGVRLLSGEIVPR